MKENDLSNTCKTTQSDFPGLPTITDSDNCQKLKIGDPVESLWPNKNTFYHGTIASIDENRNKLCVEYDYGDTKALKMTDELLGRENSETANAHKVEISL